MFILSGDIHVIDVMFADDHQLAVEGLSFFLSTVEGINVLKIVTNGKDIAAALKEYNPDVLILDMGLPGRHGLEVLLDMKSNNSSTKVIVLTGLDDASLLRDAVMTGAQAVLTKASDTDEILTALYAVQAGEKYLGKFAAATLRKAYPDLDLEQATALLTKRENEILLMIADGKNSHQISITLDIAEPTVRKHRQNLMEKLSLHNSAEITAYVLNRGLNN